MKRVWLDDAQGRLGKAAATALKALGWRIAGEPGEADVLVLVLGGPKTAGAMPEGAGTLILLAPGGDRRVLAALSLEAQNLAVAVAPGKRVNAIAVDDDREDRLGATIEWLAGAEMVTGQLILLSSTPGASIPL